ncbi:MAG: NAD(+)/NADH kinase [Candidatus Aenigmarchaeota archaeon]|nr:NAD(+)/NADH kinase [Candidatus Aenigmarchaeota archaeon]
MKLRKKKKTKISRKGINSILIVAKQNKVGLQHAIKLEKMLQNRVKEVNFDRSTAIRLRKLGHSIRKFSGDLIITLGGDGTFLWTAHKTDVPILPVKLEGQGFLCSLNFKQLTENLDRILKKDFNIKERMRLRCAKIQSGKIQKYVSAIRHSDYPLALNEIAFARKRPSKILNIEFKIDGVVFDMIGDGVMFSTPSGSTAYSSSAGGSMIDPSMEMISIIPLYPFFSKIKPMIIPKDKRIEVTVAGGDCALVIDGHGGDYIKKNSSFMIEAATPVKIVTLFEQNFYEKVRKNLMS